MTLAPPRLPRPGTATNQVASIGIFKQVILQSPQLVVCPMRYSEGDKRGEFDKQHELIVRF